MTWNMLLQARAGWNESEQPGMTCNDPGATPNKWNRI